MVTNNKSFIDAKFIKKNSDLQESGLFNTIRTLEKGNISKTVIMGKPILNFNSNNFLGFSEDPSVVKAAQEALSKYGVGPGAVRSISGSLQLHIELEKELAKFKRAEDCVVVQSGFVANTALLPILLGPDDCIISDALNHASIIDGIQLAKTNKMIFKHSDMEDLENKVQKAKKQFSSGIIVIATDGVFSMDGEICNLPGIVEIAKKHGAFTYLDDAWGELSLGQTGRGTTEHYNLHGKVDFEVGTLSKGFGVQGGFVTGPSALIKYFKQRSRPFIFSTGLGVAECGAVLAVLKELNYSNERIKKLRHNIEYFSSGLKKMGFEVVSKTQIIPLMICDEKKTQAMSKLLYEHGIFVTPIVFPTVPKNTARCRFIVSAMHTIEDLDTCLAIIKKCAKQLKIID